MIRASTFALVSASLLLVGCNAASTYSPSDLNIQITGFYNDGAADRDLRLVVIGNPFPAVPDAVFKGDVEAALQGQSIYDRAPTSPKLAPGPSAKPLYSLVYAFGQPNTVSGNALCMTDPSRAVPVPPGPAVTATAAFCVGDMARSFISGYVPAAGPNDLGLVQLERQMMAEVFRRDIPMTGPPHQILD